MLAGSAGNSVVLPILTPVAERNERLGYLIQWRYHLLLLLASVRQFHVPHRIARSADLWKHVGGKVY